MKIDLANTDTKAIIDDEDYDKIKRFKWSINRKNGHVKSYVGNQTWKYLSRLILDVEDKSIQIDHKDFNKLNCRKYNLRVCTNAQNSRNQRKRSIGNFTSKYKGVCWSQKIKRWRVTLTYNYKQLYVGTFLDEKEAALAYNKRAIEIFGEFACLNEVN